MADNDLDAFHPGVLKNFHQGRKIELAADQQSTLAEGTRAAPRKDPVALNLAVFRVVERAACQVLDGGCERHRRVRLENLATYLGAAMRIDIYFQF